MSKPIAVPVGAALRTGQRSAVLAVSLLRVRRIGYIVLSLQFAGFLVWSTVLYRRFALTLDFAQFNQAWFLISHGNLDPFDTARGYPFWQDHGVFIMWPLAVLYWVWPNSLLLLWLQDAGVVIAEAVVFTWICELVQRYRPGKHAAWLAGTGLALLAANPWTWWAISYDFHLESVAVPLVALLVRDLWNGRKRAWVWVAPLVACGDVADTYLAGIGLAVLLTGRRTRLRGAVLMGIGVAATFLLAAVHGNLGSGGGLQDYSYLATAPPGTQLGLAAVLKGIITHPITVVRKLWSRHLAIWANFAPSGLVGPLFLWLLPVSVVVLLENNLPTGLLFAPPSFQDLPLFALLPAGTVAVLAWLLRRWRRIAILAACLVVAQAIGWAIVWGPRTADRWLRVTGPAAATLAAVDARIPKSAEVIVSEGVMGHFSDRSDIHGLIADAQDLYASGRERLPVQAETWFVIAPADGIETQSTASATALIADLAGPLHATLVAHANGIWAFRYMPPPGVHAITVPGNWTPQQAWAAPVAPGGAGRAVMTGPVGTWHVTSTGQRGYVADGIAWQEPPGRYQAHVTLSATGPVNVEVWNDSGDKLLSRYSIPATPGVDTVSLPVNATIAYRPYLYTGWGPFRAEFIPPPPGNRLEVRVWSSGRGIVNVFRAELIAAGPVSRR